VWGIETLLDAEAREARRTKAESTFWDIRLALLDAGVEFNGIEHPLKRKTLRNLSSSFRTIYSVASSTRYSFIVFVTSKYGALFSRWVKMTEIACSHFSKSVGASETIISGRSSPPLCQRD
jgi:hypothetical protein